MLNNFYFKNLLKSSLHSKGFRKWEINDKTDLVCYCWDIKRRNNIYVCRMGSNKRRIERCF
jgi:hypothetical protein